MKKVLSVLLFTLLIIMINGCKEKEEIKNYKIENLIGTWELSSAKIYDRELKFLTQTDPKDQYGCGFITWIYTSDKIQIINYTGKDQNGNCLEQIIDLTYTLENNNIITLDELGIKEKMLITDLSKDELVFLTQLPNEKNDDANFIKYVKIWCKRVK
ncbi:lipocalin family protein [Myroides sp. LJL119]